MTKKIQRLLQIMFFAVMGGLLLTNCESDADKLGSQFFNKDAAQAGLALNDVIAYNISHNDTIRTDAAKLDSVAVGAFNLPQFGVQKSAYYSQLRLNVYSPTFGVNPVADSAVIVIKPAYASDSIQTTTNSTYIYPVGNVSSTKVVNTYPLSYKYGRTKIGGKTTMTIKVNEVNDFMGSALTQLFSNQDFAEGALLGSKTFNGNITSVNIKSNVDQSVLYNTDPTLRIPLDGTFFQNKIIAKVGMPELTDVSSFIRYFKGLKISVTENDGFLFKFAPNDVTLQLYYKNDVVANGVTTRPQSSFLFDVGSSNAHYEKIDYNRSGTTVATIPVIPNSTIGDSKLYPQGMGGPGIGIKIPDVTVGNLKNFYKSTNAGILSAKIRLYSDASWINNFKKPKSFIIQQKNVGTFLQEFTTYALNSNYHLITINSLYTNPTYYDLDVTKTVKNVIETEAPNIDFVLNVGQYTINPTGFYNGLLTGNASYGQNFNTRSYTPNGLVLVGTDPTSINRAQLRVVYATKQ